MNDKRVRVIEPGINQNGPVIYWMSRDQRVYDNWALLFAQELALQRNEKLLVIFTVVSEFGQAAFRQYAFMIKGLQEVEKTLAELNIPFHLLTGNPEDEIPGLINKLHAGILVTDFDPIRVKKEWKASVADKVPIPIYEVDSHNIVPAFFVSGKEEFAARTLRPKITKSLTEFLEEIPQPEKMSRKNKLVNHINKWDEIYFKLKIDFTVPEVDWVKPGEKAALNVMQQFLKNRIFLYYEFRNDPVRNVSSKLSPYLHFGQISAQRIALEIEKIRIPANVRESFLEQLIVRRELSDNFCYYNKNYDSFEGFPEWAQITLNNHENDNRKYIYSLEEFERARTHDDLWNAAQAELVVNGMMHGYMRMYWAKKILEWSRKPREALTIAMFLNDKYSLDGRDPNGYVGCAWAIGGVHDRAWKERPIFGKIRYMNRKGCERKFDVEAYIKKFGF